MSRIVVAKPGYSILSDKRFLSLDSDEDNLMVIDEFYSDGTDSSYNHGLGYLPATLEFYQYDSKWFPVGQDPVDISGEPYGYGTGVWSPQLEYDSNNIYIDNPDNLSLKVFIFGNSADNQTGTGNETAFGKMRIAKSGYDVDTAKDIREFRFCSGLNVFKKDLGLSSSVEVEYGHVTVTHNFGYPPIVIARDNDGRLLPYNGAFAFEPSGFYVTDTQIIFYNYYGYTPTYYYNIYRDKIN